MIDLELWRGTILKRLDELGVRMHHIESELGEPKPSDLQDQAIDLEDDEVLESLGHVAQKEVALLKSALSRIEDKTYGVCLSCGEDISIERLKAVPYAPLCKKCASAGPH